MLHTLRTLTPAYANDRFRCLAITHQIEQYLLEVTRVVKQAEGENNFHILFQLLSAKDEAGGGQKPKGNDSSGQSSFARKQTNSNKSGAFASLLNDEKLKEQLDLRQSSHFHYLDRGGAIPVKGMTDSDGWATTLDCLQALNLEVRATDDSLKEDPPCDDSLHSSIAHSYLPLLPSAPTRSLRRSLRTCDCWRQCSTWAT